VTRRWGRNPVRTGLVQAVEGAARQVLAASTTPGLAVALVQHGQVVWAAGYGLADPATGQPVTATTCFQAASLSKPVTAWGVLRLVESGRIGLDEPVIGHLGRWRPPPSLVDADGITVRRLLSHTAGLSVHGYVGQISGRPLPPIAASLSGETGDGFRSSCWSRLAGAGCTRVAATACCSCWSRSSPVGRSPTTCRPRCWSRSA
jgi:CubicO group peptidase (beta-lactamase class C family)